MKRFINITAAAMLVLGVLLSPFATTKAFAESRAIALSPMSQRIILTPGETYRGGFTVSNPANETEDLSYLVTVGSYFPASGENSKDDYGDIDIATVTNMNMMMDWITVENPTGTLHPNDSEVVEFTIDVPESAPAGGQYASLLVKEDRSAESVDDSTTVTEIMQMAHVIYAEVAGETIEEGEITENNVPSFLLNNTLETTSMVRNNGNVHTDASYTLHVWPLGSDEEICTNEEDPGSSLVMPGTERYNTQSCELSAVGIYKVKQTVKIFGEESIVEKMVIVCPVWLLFIIFFVIAAIIIWIVMRVRGRKKSARESD